VPEIETGRLRLRMSTKDALDNLAHLFSDPEMMRCLAIEAGQTYSREKAKPFLNDLYQ